MKLDRTVRRLLAADADGPELRRAARDVAHELRRNRLPVLAELQTSLARIQADGTDHFVAGYRAAIADLVAAYSASIAPDIDVAVARESVARRRHWRAVLEILQAKPATPTEVAERLRMNLSSASRTLSELREMRLVEESGAGEGADLRVRLQQLSMFGEQVCDSRPSQPYKAQMTDVLARAVSIFSMLATERSVWKSDLKDLEITGEDSLLEDLIREQLLQASLVTDTGVGLQASEMFVQDYVTEGLSAAIQSDAPPSFWTRLCSLVRTGDAPALFVRSAGPAHMWDQVLELVRDQEPSVWRFASARTVTKQDFRFWAMPAHTQPVALVYESVPVLLTDQERNLEYLEPLIDAAQYRFCLVSSKHVQLPAGWDPVPVRG